MKYYKDDDETLFDIGPVLGKGLLEFNQDEPRIPKGQPGGGQWTTGGGGGPGSSKKPKGGGATRAKKPAAKPKAPAKPKAAPKKKPAAKPKAPKKPKAETKPASKPRKPAAPKQPKKPVEESGLALRDRADLEHSYHEFDRVSRQIDEATQRIEDAKRVRPMGWENIAFRDVYARQDLMRRQSALRSTITNLEGKLGISPAAKRLAKLFKESDTAVDFGAALAKLTPNNAPSANPNLGLVFGWAIVCKNGDEPYFDTQGDHIPEESMLKAATDFMLTKRDMKVMHKGKRMGTVVFAWPVTKDIAKAMGLDGSKTGLMIGVKPDNPMVVDRFRSGEYRGFSIGGNRLIDEPVE